VSQPEVHDLSLYERWRWRIFAITWLAYAGLYLTRKSFPIAKIELAKPEVMGWNKTDMAWVDGAFGVAYALANFFWGAWGDRFGTRKVVLGGLLASVTVAVLMGASSSVVLIGLLFGIQGICQATGWGPLAKNIGAFFSRRERGWVLGLWCTNMPIGDFAAGYLASLAAAYAGWRWSLWAPAGCLLVIALLFWLLQRDRPEDVGLPPIERYHGDDGTVLGTGVSPDRESEGTWQALADTLKNRMVLVLAFAYLLVKPTRYLIMFWAPLYIRERLGTGVVQSSVLGSLPDLAALISPFLGGWVSDKWFQTRRMPVSVLALAGCAFLWFSFGYLPPTTLALGLGLFGIGFLIYIPEALLSASAAIDFAGRKATSTASGLINGSGSLGAVVGLTIPGWIHHVISKDQDIWPPIFITLGVSLAVAALLLIPHWNRLPAGAKGK
jgi:OPA family sugar phosphate sensor protein UhpC-like MFS transporter